MEYLILAITLCMGGILFFCKNLREQKKREAWMAAKFREEFGTPAHTEDVWERKEAVSGYFRRHKKSFFIDDITYNDLELDRLFSKMDTACSSAGQEYLYHMLRTPSFSEEELNDREERIRFWTQDEELRIQMKMLFWKMGKTGKYSIYDYIDFLDNLGEPSNRKHVLCWILFLPAVGLLYVSPALGMAALFGVIIYNIAAYLREKKIIDPYLVCFRYVLRAIDTGKKMTEISGIGKSQLLAQDTARIRQLLAEFEGLKRSAHFGMHVMGDGGNPLNLVTDYINMILHLDLMGFNLMLKQLRSHIADVDELLELLGKTEALIAVASYRASLPVWCVPVLVSAAISENKRSDTEEADRNSRQLMPLEIQGLAHPLLTDPVRNDIRADRGVLVTGSNASGKSTFLKEVAINVILAQTLHTCAAEGYCGSFYRVLSSIALRDDLESSESYYIVEIKSLKRILDSVKEQGAPVLCFVDEVLRGTNTVERIAASTQILKSLQGAGGLCFAATHDIELTELLEKEYANYHFQEQVEKGDISFPYQLMPGRAQTRNAIRLLAIMGYEEEIIERADRLAAHFLQNGRWK